MGQRIRGVPEGTWIPHIEASKHARGTAYVVFDDHRRGNWKPYIYRTEDFGRRWSSLADEDQIWGFVHTLEEDPVTPNLLFAGTEFGLYVSLDRGENWFPWRHGVPPVPVRSLVIHPGITTSSSVPTDEPFTYSTTSGLFGPWLKPPES